MKKWKMKHKRKLTLPIVLMLAGLLVFSAMAPATCIQDARDRFPGISYIGERVKEMIQDTTAIKDEAETITGVWTFSTNPVINEIDLDDDEYIKIGTSDDWIIYAASPGTSLYIKPAADDQTIYIGYPGYLSATTQYSVDIVWTANASDETVTFDAGASKITLTNVSLELGTGASFSISADDIQDSEVADDLTIDGGSVDDSAIGGSTPSTGAFTDLDATGTVTISSASVTITATAIELLNDDWQNDEVADDLTINGGTVDNTIIGGTTAASATFTDVHLTGDSTFDGHSDGRVFLANVFQYSAPGTDWTPKRQGAYLAADKSAKNVWIPLNFLKIGDEIVSYKLVGDAVETNALTVDCGLYSVNLANPLTTTAITDGTIAQITVDGDFDVEADCEDTTVTTDCMYILEITATTTTSDTVTIIGAEVTINRKL